jgi:endonuclease YncB( thermonuclease family)
VFTKLSSESFTIITRWQNDPGRVSAFVRLGGRDLGGLLVKNGLGRIHGQTVNGLTKPMRDRFAELEEEAKASGRGDYVNNERACDARLCGQSSVEKPYRVPQVSSIVWFAALFVMCPHPDYLDRLDL